MTPFQRIVAVQLAAALRDAMPVGAFDEQQFLDTVLADDAPPVDS